MFESLHIPGIIADIAHERTQILSHQKIIACNLRSIEQSCQHIDAYLSQIQKILGVNDTDPGHSIREAIAELHEAGENTMSYLSHGQPLAYSEQQEHEADRAAWEDAHPLPPLPRTIPTPDDSIEWWLGQAREALDSYRNRHGQVEAVGHLYHCCIELAELARGRERPSEEELVDEAEEVTQVRKDIKLPSLSFNFDDLTY